MNTETVAKSIARHEEEKAKDRFVECKAQAKKIKWVVSQTQKEWGAQGEPVATNRGGGVISKDREGG